VLGQHVRRSGKDPGGEVEYSGCPGVGPKAALEILTEFDDLEKALLNAETVICGGRLSQTNRRKLREGAASTRLSHALATLRTDAPLRGLESFDDLRALPVPDGVL
jgi:5'-3' exonuclease